MVKIAVGVLAALAIAVGGYFGFEFYVQQRIANDIEAGSVKINRTTTGNLVNAPFGGVKRSSTSTFRESGRVGLEFFTQLKTIYRGC